MNLTEQMNDDLDLFLDEDGMAEACTFKPKGQGTGGPASVIRGDAPPSPAGDPVLSSSATVRFMGRLSVLRAIILAQEGEPRNPAAGDVLEFADHTATVLSREPEGDASDACWLVCSIATIDAFTTGRRS